MVLLVGQCLLLMNLQGRDITVNIAKEDMRKKFVLKHMEICPMKTDPKEDIREMILRTMVNK